MSSDFAISARGLGKAYRIWDRPSARLLSPLLHGVGHLFPADSAARSSLGRRAALHYHDFHALRDVSFDVPRGEALGIVGRNGSGKSTLLQIVAGILQPSSGTFEIRGRVAALLELGSGFNPEFTGRENVLLNATVFGLKRDEIATRMDAIAAFADIGDFLDQAVKTYSSGMVLRLAFAVAAHVEPEILVVDEALAVGDARFQLKCARRIDQFRERGGTLLFVSHDMNMVKGICSRALLLEHGSVVHQGGPNDISNLYSKLMVDGGSVEALAADLRSLQERQATPGAPGKTERGATAPAIADRPAPLRAPAVAPIPHDEAAMRAEISTLRARVKALEKLHPESPPSADWEKRVGAVLREERTHQPPSANEFSYGGELGRIMDFKMVDADGTPRTWYTTGEEIEVRMEVEASTPVVEPIFALRIKNPIGQEIYGTNTLFQGQAVQPLSAGDRRVVRFRFPANLIAGEYFLSLGFTQFVGEELVVLHRRHDAMQFSVHGTDRSFGVANCFARITIEPA